jgi:hypothetical protein
MRGRKPKFARYSEEAVSRKKSVRPLMKEKRVMKREREGERVQEWRHGSRSHKLLYEQRFKNEGLVLERSYNATIRGAWLEFERSVRANIGRWQLRQALGRRMIAEP